jgi:hypothetical protein
MSEAQAITTRASRETIIFNEAVREEDQAHVKSETGTKWSVNLFTLESRVLRFTPGLHALGTAVSGVTASPLHL